VSDIPDADGYLAFSSASASGSTFGITAFGGVWQGEDNFVFSAGFGSSLIASGRNANVFLSRDAHVFFLFTDPEDRKNTYVRYIWAENEEGLFKCRRTLGFESPLDNIIRELRAS